MIVIIVFHILKIQSQCCFFFVLPGQQQCDMCPQDTYSMLGASKCLPLPNCTDDDIIKAPDNLDSCSCRSGEMCNTTVVPSYVKVRGKFTQSYDYQKDRERVKVASQETVHQWGSDTWTFCMKWFLFFFFNFMFRVKIKALVTWREGSLPLHVECCRQGCLY